MNIIGSIPVETPFLIKVFPTLMVAIYATAFVMIVWIVVRLRKKVGKINDSLDELKKMLSDHSGK